MPDPITSILFLLNVVWGICMWLAKNAYSDLKEQVKENRLNLEKSIKKEDFKEFKEELWQRFDKMEIAFNEKIKDVKNG